MKKQRRAGSFRGARERLTVIGRAPGVDAPDSDVLPKVEGHRAWYETVEEIQKALEACLLVYNTERAHQGRNMNGRTPLKAILDGLLSPEGRPDEKAA